MRPHVVVLLCWAALPLQALQIFDPEEVEYIQSEAAAAPGGSVTLDCGASVPSIFIWGFTKAGTDSNMALAYNYGHGATLQAQAGGLGRLRVPANSSALVIEDLQREAAGMFTCQALYDSGGSGASVTFYFTKLEVVEDD